MKRRRSHVGTWRWFHRLGSPCSPSSASRQRSPISSLKACGSWACLNSLQAGRHVRVILVRWRLQRVGDPPLGVPMPATLLGISALQRRRSGRPLCADIVEKLEFPRRSQLRRPLAASMEISLGAQRSDRFFCVRPSLSPCCGKHPWRQRFPRGSGIFAAPQFPTFSTISAKSGHSPMSANGSRRAKAAVRTGG